jgi:hypothetical protein
MHEFDLQQQIIMVWNQTLQHKTIFIFAVINTVMAVEKRSYIFVIRKNSEMLELFESNGKQCLLDSNDMVFILKDYKTLDIIKLKEIEEFQFVTS